MMQTASEDRPSLEDLFEEHGSRAFRAAYRVTGNTTDAEDVVQTVFVRLLKRPDAIQRRDTAGSYLHRAAVNAGLDLLRKRKRSRSVAIDDEADRDPALHSEREDSESRLRSREIRDNLRSAMSRLKPAEAEVFALRYLEGLGNSEIAELLDTSRETIGVRLFRCRARLKTELADLVDVGSGSLGGAS
ncbi:MAG: RNA polymerase sigma factor [Acidobacteria bacterium]|nr:MAG: RNA polymerase sigma factor [Acidobacteriota bacterium]REK07948.1 MAG: RNA polymerase sigma factor [Acidobacteriota bacterium]